MSQDFGSFIILYIIICIGFALIGNINFVAESNQFENFLDSILTVVDASLGNFQFELIDKSEDKALDAGVISDGKDSTSGTTNLH